MVKRIIFDFDNTLVAFNKAWDIEVNRTFDDYNIDYDEDILRKFQESLSKYEKETTVVDYDDADKYFSNYIGIDLPKGFIKSWTMRLSKVKPPVDKRLNEMLERLSKNAKITLSILFCFIGICFITSTYFSSMKGKVFMENSR